MARSLHGDTGAVALAFLERRREKSGAMTTDGHAIYSYNWQLAHWDAGGALVLDRADYVTGYRTYTATTNKHTRGLRRVLEAHGYPMPTPEYFDANGVRDRYNNVTFTYQDEDRAAVDVPLIRVLRRDWTTPAAVLEAAAVAHLAPV